MRVTRHLLGVFAATLFAAGQAVATPVLPEGTAITGTPASLLGYDAGLNDYVSGGLSAVNDQNIEFFTDDFALGIDFQSNGLLRLWDNLGSGDDLFNYTLRFSLSGLDAALTNIQLLDVRALTAGNLLFNIVDDSTFDLVLRDVQFSPGFSHADLGISVDEPSMMALLAVGLLGAYAARRRRSTAVRNTEVAL
jgi:hypothetical protein